MVSPNQETDDRDSDARTGDEGVSEDRFARKSRNDLADHAHRWKNHDVYGGMRIEPEEMLEKDGIAAQSGIEEAEVKHAFEAGKQQGDGNYRRPKNHHQAGGVMGPGEKR